MAKTNKPKSKKAVVAKGGSKKVDKKASNKSVDKGATKSNRAYRPNGKMLALLRAKLNPEVKPTITAECEAAGINRTTYYRWFENEKFVAWFQEAFAKGMRERESYLDKVGMIKATEDYRYWEGLQTKYHGFKKKVDIGGEGLKIVLGDDPDPDYVKWREEQEKKS